MNIWIFNHHAQGPEIPGGTRHYDLAKQLVSYGHRVVIFSAGFHYLLLKETVEYNKDGFKIEDKDGVRFVWIKTYPYKVNNIKRMVNIISYSWRLNFLIPRLDLDKPDIIIGSTVHPFAPIIGYRFSKRYNTPFVFEIRDLWPQSFLDMGAWHEKDMVSKVFKSIEKYTVKRADTIISLSPMTEGYLKDEYEYEYGKNIYIPNSVDIDSVNKNKLLPDMNDTFEQIIKLKDDGKVLYMFTGAIVQSNSINIFVEVARKLKIKNIQIVLVGKGQERARYEQIFKDESLFNISFLDPVDKKLVPKLLDYADVLILIQGNVKWGSSNKLYDYLAAKKPIITSLYVKHNDVIEGIGCGYSSGYNDSDEIVINIGKVYSLSRGQQEEMGRSAYNYVSQNHDIKLMAQKLEKLCKGLVFND